MDQGIALLGISVDDSAQALDRMVAAKGIPWPQLWDGKEFAGEIPKLYAMDATPLLYLVDRAGRLAGRFRSVSEVERELPEVIAAPTSVPRTPRDQWQRPYAVMDSLRIRRGTVVADIGSGDGYLTWHLAARVGQEGRVYAVDIDEKALATLRQSAQAQKLSQVETVLGAADDPRLPVATLEVALIVDAYHEFTAHEGMLRGMYAALRPGGRLGILEISDALGLARREYQERHRLPAEVLVEDAARQGFRLASFEADFASPPAATGHYLIVLKKPE